MLGIGVGVEQADRDRAIAAGLERRDQRAPDRGFVERRDDRAVGAEPLRRLEAILAAHRRRGLGVEEVVDVAPVVALHEQQVAKTRRGDEGHRRYLALQYSVGGDRRAVAEIFDAREVDARRGECCERTDVWVSRRARHLGDDDLAAVDGYQVGEGAADLDANAHEISAPRAWPATRRSA